MAETGNRRPGKRPTMRQIAREAGVCPMTVSLSLRHHPSISEPTRKRVQGIADAMGYLPDPKLNQLMEHLRKQRDTGSSAAMVIALCQRYVPHRHGYPEEVLEGARQRAGELGFYFDHMWLEEGRQHPAKVNRFLEARGAECVLLLPMMDLLDLGELVKWERYTVVSTSATVTHPQLNTVLPDQFGNTLALCGHLSEQGAVRIGLVASRDFLLRVKDRAAAAVSWHNTRKGLIGPPALISEDYELERTRLLGWLEQWQLDTIITESRFFAHMIHDLLKESGRGDIRLACASLLANEPEFPGIFENPRAVGATAMELLDRQYRTGDKGIPANPAFTLISGHLRMLKRTAHEV